MEAGSKDPREQQRLTVAQLREEKPDVVEVAFFESTRFFVLRRSHPDFEELQSILRGSLDSAVPVSVRLGAPDGSEIIAVHSKE